MENAIVNALLRREDESATAVQLEEELTKYSKTQINACLYQSLEKKKLVERFKKEGDPKPRWRAVKSAATPPARLEPSPGLDDYGCDTTTVLVDLGNVHDVLQTCEGYVKSKVIDDVYGIADYHFNDYGVNPKPSDITGVIVLQATDAQKNSGDVLLVWEVSRIIALRRRAGIHFIVATMSKKLHYLANLAAEKGHVMHFVRDLKGLRELVEEGPISKHMF